MVSTFENSISTDRTEETTAITEQTSILDLTTTSLTTANDMTSSTSSLRNPISTEQIESTRMKHTEQSTSVSSYTTLWTTAQSDTMSPTLYQDSSTESTLSMTSMPNVTMNTYIQFILSFSAIIENLINAQLAFKLHDIFTFALHIYSNQINITVIVPMTRTLGTVLAQVRLFDSTLESADSLLARLRIQLADSSSTLRDNELTFQLTNDSITDVTSIYICNGSTTEQETPCLTTTMTPSTSKSSLTTILPVTIILSIIGVVFFVLVIVLIVRHLRQRHGSSFFFRRQYHELIRL